MNYQWRHYNYPVSAQAAGEYLSDLERRQGGVSPATVVDEARPEEAVLHPCFEWQDEVAAEKYREYQARNVIKNVVCVIPVGSDPRPTTAFVNVTVNKESNPQRQYVSTMIAMQDPDLKSQVMQNAINELNAFRKKYKELEELARLIPVIDEVTTELNDKIFNHAS